ncbi:glycosyltransferase family 4 protein [Ekhidna sp.]|uniref:glycosyltransferase family 4 protein n=1 Tax=Ekhidna sp. TaxID=2608089 RepID=UPI003B592E4B
MKVGIIDHVGRKAGMDYYTSSLAEGLAENGADVFIYSNFAVSNTSYKAFSVFPFFVKNPILRFVRIFRGFALAISSLKKNRIKHSIVHLFSADLYYVFLLLLLKISGQRLILISHDSQSFAGSESMGLRKFCYNILASRIIVHNAYSLESTLPLINKKDKIVSIKHGSFENLVDSSITREKARKRYGLKEGDFFAVFFGQIKRIKRLDVFLLAVECGSNIRYHVAGRVWKDDFDSYKRIIDSKDSTCLTLDIGYISDSERENLFKSADAIVLPYDEVYQSGVLLMAMSYGVCPIVSNIKAFKEIIEDNENGLLFEQGNSKSLAHVISLLAKNSDLKQKISRNAREYVKSEFSWDSIAKEYIDKVLG